MEKVKVGISIGDINGIGPEVVLKTFLDKRMLDVCTPVVYVNPEVLKFHSEQLELELPNLWTVKGDGKVDPQRINVVPCWDESLEVQFGQQTPSGGKAAFLSLQKAAQALASGEVDVLVTAPIHKKSIQSQGFSFPGHTEYLADMASAQPLMLLVADDLRVGIVTGHIALKEVPSKITEQAILDKLEIMQKALKQDFGITKPKIAVLGLNPHAGESGAMGTEEIEIIGPAIEKARGQDILAMGPFPADGFFGVGMHAQYDGVLAMYHDQGLAPFKSMAFDLGVNYTAGLPIVRTSPDHGTGFAIAGKGEASEQSFRSSVYLACDVFKQRKAHKDMTANPLKISARKTDSRKN